MKRVEGVLPANTGVVIRAEEGTYTFAESDATPAVIGDNERLATNVQQLL